MKSVNHRFIDTHCHFDFPPFCHQVADSLARAALVGVQGLIVPAITADRFDALYTLAADNPVIHVALGLHPRYIAQHGEAQLAILDAKLAQRQQKVVAIGEIGLDLDLVEPQLERQCRLLRQQLSLARCYDLPVILHSRRTHDILAKELRQAALPRTGVVHGFSGSLSQAQAFIRLGYAIGVSGVISYPRAEKTRRVMAALPLSALVLETDAPDMPLMGFQGQPNRPERIVQIFNALCELRPSDPPAMMAETLYQNSLNLFLS